MITPTQFILRAAQKTPKVTTPWEDVCKRCLSDSFRVQAFHSGRIPT